MTAKKVHQVYVVDDSEIQLLFLEKVLKKAGYEVCAFTDGLALASQCLEEPPQLIISDIDMPKINGFDLFHALNRENDLPKVPFFFTSSNIDLATQDKVRAVGANGFFAKPISRRQLLQTIKTTLN